MSVPEGTAVVPTTARAVVQTATGGFDVLRVQDVAVRAPAATQVMIAVEAAGLNFSDLLARTGMYPDAPSPPAVLGYEVAGTIVAVGSQVADWAPGDVVMAATRFGGHASHVVTDEVNVVRAPSGLGMAECASIPVAFATAYAAVVRYGGLHRGERVLVHSGAGGVGSAAVQLAEALGAEVHATASRGKHEWVRGLGATVVHDSQDTTWLASAPGYDLILDPLGPRSFRRSLGMLHAGGRVVVFGVSDLQSGERRNLLHVLRSLRAWPGALFIDLMRSSKSVIGFNALAVWDHYRTLRPLIEPVLPMIESGAVRPQVDSVFAFSEADQAHRRLLSREARGKVVLVPPRPGDGA